MSPLKKTYQATFRSLKSHPLIYVPFIIFATLESIALSLIYLAPRMPLRLVLGPPIKTFWGERFLHYPANFILLPKLASLNRMALTVILSSLLTGVAVAMAYDIYNKKVVKLSAAFKAALKKYIYLFFVVFIFTLSFFITSKIISVGLARYFIAGHSRLLFLKASLWLGPVLSGINFIIALIIQSAFIYAIPVLIIGNKNLIKSIVTSFALFKKLFIPTLILVGLPMLFYLPIMVLNYNTLFLIYRVFPEFVLLVSFLGIIMSSLVIDPLVTISVTLFYLDTTHKDA